MSPSIPNGFDMNCTCVNVDDFSTIICQSLLSNDHLTGLKEQGYMSLEQKLDRFKFVPRPQNQRSKRGDIDENSAMDLDKEDLEFYRQEPMVKFEEDFLVFKDSQDILNKEIHQNQKEIETELLRLDQFHYNVEFNTYKGRVSNEMEMDQDRNTRTVKVDKTFLSKPTALDPLEKISPADLDLSFY